MDDVRTYFRQEKTHTNVGALDFQSEEPSFSDVTRGALEPF